MKGDKFLVRRCETIDVCTVAVPVVATVDLVVVVAGREERIAWATTTSAVFGNDAVTTKTTATASSFVMSNPR